MIPIPRPRKHRRIGFHPCYSEFGPQGQEAHDDWILLKLDELESIRLMDLENLDQQACADRMGIGRSTFQRIYKEARHKIAESIIHGKRLILEQESDDQFYGNGRRHRHGRK